MPPKYRAGFWAKRPMAVKPTRRFLRSRAQLTAAAATASEEKDTVLARDDPAITHRDDLRHIAFLEQLASRMLLQIDGGRASNDLVATSTAAIDDETTITTDRDEKMLLEILVQLIDRCLVVSKAAIRFAEMSRVRNGVVFDAHLSLAAALMRKVGALVYGPSALTGSSQLDPLRLKHLQEQHSFIGGYLERVRTTTTNVPSSSTDNRAREMMDGGDGCIIVRPRSFEEWNVEIHNIAANVAVMAIHHDCNENDHSAPHPATEEVNCWRVQRDGNDDEGCATMAMMMPQLADGASSDDSEVNETRCFTQLPNNARGATTAPCEIEDEEPPPERRGASPGNGDEDNEARDDDDDDPQKVLLLLSTMETSNADGGATAATATAAGIGDDDEGRVSPAPFSQLLSRAQNSPQWTHSTKGAIHEWLASSCRHHHNYRHGHDRIQTADEREAANAGASHLVEVQQSTAAATMMHKEETTHSKLLMEKVYKALKVEASSILRRVCAGMACRVTLGIHRRSTQMIAAATKIQNLFRKFVARRTVVARRLRVRRYLRDRDDADRRIVRSTFFIFVVLAMRNRRKVKMELAAAAVEAERSRAKAMVERHDAALEASRRRLIEAASVTRIAAWVRRYQSKHIVAEALLKRFMRQMEQLHMPSLLEASRQREHERRVESNWKRVVVTRPSPSQR